MLGYMRVIGWNTRAKAGRRDTSGVCRGDRRKATRMGNETVGLVIGTEPTSVKTPPYPKVTAQE